ncbi:hypothetical protein [Nocardia sp. NPDC056000]|uniref:DUF7373 family lipoprotein n=1 Tax=Nocardia sp. NPDC056000 TaxID=3345674 RepID=UPI0035DB6802
MRLRRFAVAALAAAIAGAPAGCGSESAATDRDPTLDVGSYSTQRPDSGYDDRPSLDRGILVESLRLGERIAFGSDVATEFAAGQGGQVLASSQGIRNIPGVAEEAIYQHHPLAEYRARFAETPFLGLHQQHFELSIALIAFPDEQAATAAAYDLAQHDNGANARNEAVSLPNYPAALSHWRPGVPNIGSWQAYRSVVVAVFVQAREAKLDQLTDLLGKTYEQQLPMLDGYTATRRDQQPNLKIDPDKLLTKLVKTSDAHPDQHDFAVYGPRTFALLGADPAAATREYDARGVESIAVSDNKYLYQLRDTAAARDFVDHLASDPTVSKYAPMAGVSGAPEVACFRAGKPNPTVVSARRFRCLIPHDALVAEVFSEQEPDVRQLAAAEYVLLRAAG